MTVTDRLVSFEGCANFRDLGGYATRSGRRLARGRVYRSDGLDAMTPADAARALDDLGLQNLVDLRSYGELERYGYGPLQGRIRHHHLPLFDELRPRGEEVSWPPELAHWYLRALERVGDRIVRVLEHLADPGVQPAVIFCSAGKDRTGLVSATLLAILGVDEDTIVEDYALSAGARVRRDRPRLRPGFDELVGELPASYREAAPGTMRSLLDEVGRTYGSLEDYARAQGAGDDLFEALRASLIV